MNKHAATFPIDVHGWVILRNLGKKVTIRAADIKIKKKRVPDTDGHHVAEADAQGGVKVRSKYYDISNF